VRRKHGGEKEKRKEEEDGVVNSAYGDKAVAVVVDEGLHGHV
jgi:hypothetical protein